MKLMVISLFLIMLAVPLVSSLDFSISYPDKVSLNETFSVIISAQTSDTYDVKIFVQDNTTNTIVSEIYNEAWKNPFYYIKSAFPAKSEFSIRAVAEANEAELCVRMRKTGSSSYSERCGGIEIKESEESSSPDDSSTDDEIEINETIKEQEQESSADFIPSTSNIVQNEQEISLSQDKIFLTPKNQQKEFTTNDEKIRLFAVYSFTAFAIILIILLALRKL